MEFLTPTDIGNRAAQHCGAPRMDPVEGFSEDSRTAGEISSCYGKLRQAELRGNAWGFACRRTMLRAVDTDTMLLVPGLWDSATTYFVGSIVADSVGNAWVSRIPDNLDYEPGTIWSAWEPYFGPLTVSLYDDDTTYNAGELVYTTAGDGTNRVYVSLQSSNDDDPSTATTWSATVTYEKNDVVTYSSVAYMSLIDLNLNQTPTSSPASWSSGTTYSAAQTVCGSDGVIYSSVGGGNIGHDPVADSGANWTNTGVLCPWTTGFVAGDGAVTWRQVGGAEFPMGVGLKTLNIIYPLGTGPLSQVTTRNVYKLPAGFIRLASQHPGQAVPTWLGGPRGIMPSDWVIENGFILTSDVGPMVLRFVADVQDVSLMDPMFCEGLAARIGMEVCETITQSGTQVGMVAKIYDEWISRAKNQNAIEQGPDEPADDDYVLVRY